jgi:group I intron endonuclease
MVIYKIVNNINEKVYIGLTTKDLSRRISEHIQENKSYIQRALNKYGLESFTISIIDCADTKEILKEKEKHWIKFYDCKAPNGYNLTDGGDGLINPSKSVRKQISKTLKGHPATSGFTGHTHKEESRKAISDGLLNSKKAKKANKKKIGKKLKPLTKEVKDKINKSKTGKKRTDVIWNKNKIMKDINPDYVNSMQGKKRPDLAEMNKLNTGRKDSLETIEKKRLAAIGKPKTKEHLKNIAIAKAKTKAQKKESTT